MAAMEETGITSFPARTFSVHDLVTAKADTGTTVSVCIPARNEDTTVASVVEAIRRDLVDGAALVDEIVVVDDHSSDRTAEVATAAGARVVDAAVVLTEYGRGHGKGEAMWKSVHASTGDLVVWVDADLVDFTAQFVVQLLGPLLTDPAIDFVKGHYARPEHDGTGGGRVTELLARPLLAQFFPELGAVAQPLSGEYAARRTLLERLPFVVGYGVDVALLIDSARMLGLDHLAQIDLGIRHHRHRPLAELGPQAVAVSQAILDRAGVRPPAAALLARPGLPPLELRFDERPPLVELRHQPADVAGPTRLPGSRTSGITPASP